MKGPIKGAQWSSAWIFGSSATWQGTSSVFNIPPTHKNTHVRFSCVTYIAITKPRGFRRFTCLRFVLHGPPPQSLKSYSTKNKDKARHLSPRNLHCCHVTFPHVRSKYLFQRRVITCISLPKSGFSFYAASTQTKQSRLQRNGPNPCRTDEIATRNAFERKYLIFFFCSFWKVHVGVEMRESFKEHKCADHSRKVWDSEVRRTLRNDRMCNCCCFIAPLNPATSRTAETGC